jgi:hypothetical protein
MSPTACNKSLNSEVGVWNRTRLVATDIGAFMTITRIEIAAGLSDKNPKRPYALQMAPGESPVFKEALVEVILRRSPVTT